MCVNQRIQLFAVALQRKHDPDSFRLVEEQTAALLLLFSLHVAPSIEHDSSRRAVNSSTTRASSSSSSRTRLREADRQLDAIDEHVCRHRWLPSASSVRQASHCPGLVTRQGSLRTVRIRENRESSLVQSRVHWAINVLSASITGASNVWRFRSTLFISVLRCELCFALLAV